MLRSKGFFWLATRMELMGSWSQAGASGSAEAAGFFYAALSEEERAELDEAMRARVAAAWIEPWGDRRQELVFVGVGLDEARLRTLLDGALLDAEELAAGPGTWATWDDPFPAWTSGETDVDDDDGDEAA